MAFESVQREDGEEGMRDGWMDGYKLNTLVH